MIDVTDRPKRGHDIDPIPRADGPGVPVEVTHTETDDVLAAIGSDSIADLGYAIDAAHLVELERAQSR
jgi:hypothetical protein